MTEILLKLQNITKRFPGVLALDDVQLELRRGEIMALVGENGAGKSTLMKVVLGSDLLDEGEMLFKGKTFSPKSPADALNSGISMIHQELTLIPSMSVAENVWIGREDKFTSFGLLNPGKQISATQQLLDKLDIQVDPTATVDTLSVANMQLVEIARAVSYDSEVIIMDEPTSALTNVEIAKLYNIIRNLSAEGTAIIFITHKMDEVFAICDSITVLRDGKYIDAMPIDNVTQDMLIHLMVGREIAELYPKDANIQIGDTVFEVNGLTREGVFTDVNFKVRSGEILGFCGLMGAGRTEIMQGIFGIDKISSGTMKIHGQVIKNPSTKKAIQNKLAMVTEDRLRKGAIHKLPVRVNVSLAYLDSICSWGFINTKKEIKDCNKMIKSMDIKVADIEQELGSLSGGNQQKAIIGRWLLTQPDVLILDEPTRGIDIGAKSEVYKIISSLARQGKAIIIVSSELPEVMGISDRILVVRHGKIVAEKERSEFNEEDLMKYAFGTHKPQ